MNRKIVINYLGLILLLESATMLPPLIIAAVNDGRKPFISFAVTMLLQIVFGGLMLICARTKDRSIYSREGCTIVALSWVVMSVFGALPFYFSDVTETYIDAFFETVSGFTTTGATILSDIEACPISILYWRSFTHWLGGMGVLAFVLAIAPMTRGSGMSLHILRAESPGPSFGKIAPKLSLSARILYSIYIILTAAELVFLLCGGMPFFDALTTSFSTAGTGGFSIKNDSFASYSYYSQTVVAVFMLLFGVNFSLYFLLFAGDFKTVFKNTELRLFLAIVALATVGCTICALPSFDTTGEAIHHAFFQVTSIISTTGFSTCDYEVWHQFAHSILLVLMVTGACAGSTCGGIKLSRIIIVFKSTIAELRRAIHPRIVKVMTIDGEPQDNEIVVRCNIFVGTYLTLIVLSTLLLSIEGFSFETNLTAVIACINNVGPGFDAAGPTESLAIFSPFGKLLLTFDMLLGRLDIFPVLLLLSPSTWSKRK